jgi:hypothetical protein
MRLVVRVSKRRRFLVRVTVRNGMSLFLTSRGRLERTCGAAHPLLRSTTRQISQQIKLTKMIMGIFVSGLWMFVARDDPDLADSEGSGVDLTGDLDQALGNQTERAAGAAMRASHPEDDLWRNPYSDDE